MASKGLRRKKSSSLLPIVRYFYRDSQEEDSSVTSTDTISTVVDVCPQRVGSQCFESSSTPPDYELLYRAMQLDNFDGNGEDRVRRKYACQGLKLVASALAEDTSALSNSEIGFSRDLYVNGVEYIIRGLPPNLSSSEKQRIHDLVKKLHPMQHSGDHSDEPYPFIIFLFRQFGLFLKRISPHVRSFAVRIVEFERQHNIARGVLEAGIGMAEKGVDFAVRLGLNDVLISFGTALGRGVGESYRVYREG